MTLNVSDYPKESFDGYYEIVDRHSTLESAYVQAMQHVGGSADALEAAAKAKRALDESSPGDVVVRVYGKADPTGEPGHAKEHSNVLVAEFAGPIEGAEAFVAEQMAKLKKAVQ